MSGRLERQLTQRWADLISESRSKVDCDKIRTILEVYGSGVIEP